MRELNLLKSSLAMCLALASVNVHAGTIKVKQTGSNPTIQSGVDAASAGDTIEIYSGTYQENVIIPSGLDGLKLKAKGEVILDAFLSGGSSTGPGILFTSNDVTIKGLIIRNAQGVPAIWVQSAGATIHNVMIESCQDDGIESGHDDVTVKGCTFSGIGGRSINSSGARLIVEDCTFRNNHIKSSVYSHGPDPTVTGCVFKDSAFYAILVEGNPGDVVIEDNKISNCKYGIWVDCSGGGNFRIQDNEITSVSSDCIGVWGKADAEEGLIKKNVISDCVTGYSIAAEECSTVRILQNSIKGSQRGVYVANCDAVTVDRNDISYILNGDGILYNGSNPTIVDNEISYVCGSSRYGIRVTDASTGGAVSGNTVKQSRSHGVATGSNCSLLTIEENEVSYCGQRNSSGNSGFYIDGDFHIVQNNTSTYSGADGFHFPATSSGHTITGNKAKNNVMDGIDVEAGSCAVSDNTCKFNSAEGIEVNGDSNAITDNTSKDNRIDMANDGAGNVFSGNDYDTGDSGTSPEID